MTAPEFSVGTTPKVSDFIRDRLDEPPRMSYRDIGKLVGCSPGRVGQIINDHTTHSPFLIPILRELKRKRAFSVEDEQMISMELGIPVLRALGAVSSPFLDHIMSHAADFLGEKPTEEDMAELEAAFSRLVRGFRQGR